VDGYAVGGWDPTSGGKMGGGFQGTLFLGLALAASPALFAPAQHGAAQNAHAEKAKVHDRGGQVLTLGQNRGQRQPDRLPIVHTHDDQEQQNYDQENRFKQQFEIHKSRWSETRQPMAEAQSVSSVQHHQLVDNMSAPC
jgi:hypothetical protein